MASDGYLPTQGRARWAVRLLLLELVLGLFLSGLGIAYVIAWHGDRGGSEQAEIQQARGNLGCFAQVLWLAGLVAFLMWQYRFVGNISRLGARGTLFSPGWAVAYWFIPILNFFRPYQVLQEMWQCSTPDGDLNCRDFWRREHRGGLVVAFWCAYIAGFAVSILFVYCIAFYLAPKMRLVEPGKFDYPLWYWVFMPALTLARCAHMTLLLLVVERLDRRISARRERWLAAADAHRELGEGLLGEDEPRQLGAP
jgi:hypothetical protein